MIAIDYGGRRIGIALSTSGVLASPHSVVPAGDDAAGRIAELAAVLEAELIVVGVARRARSRDGEQKFETFAEALRQKTCKPVILWDETLSTVEAAERLRSAGGKRSRDLENIDMYAAAVILQSYLDAQAGRTS